MCERALCVPVSDERVPGERVPGERERVSGERVPGERVRCLCLRLRAERAEPPESRAEVDFSREDFGFWRVESRSRCSRCSWCLLEWCFL